MSRAQPGERSFGTWRIMSVCPKLFHLPKYLQAVIPSINGRSGQRGKQKTGWLQIAYIIYICGFVASLIFLCFRAIALSISLKKLEKCGDDAILEHFACIKERQLGIKKDIEILIDKNKSVPALAGVFGTKLILPEKAASQMSEARVGIRFYT